VFSRLEAEQLGQITEMMLEQTKRRAHAQGLTLEFTPEAVSWLSRTGYRPEFGARPLRRTIQREVDKPVVRPDAARWTSHRCADPGGTG
jgi:ATP-dependent Clp protease ATP-binding subunit ClpC